MKLSVVIPAHNEQGHIASTVKHVAGTLTAAAIDHEVLVVNDHSGDRTEEILKGLRKEVPTLRYVNNESRGGFGFAVRCGLSHFTGDAVVIVMADESDAPEDIIKFWRKIEEGYDCSFGSRFMKGSKVIDYPWPKLTLNRVANAVIKIIFGLNYNDVTNAFKMYRRHVIEGLQPLMSHHFNLTVELPLKAIVRGYTFSVTPNSWTNRKEGVSKFKIKEMGSRYFFIMMYCLIEKWFSRGDYYRRDLPQVQTSVSLPPELKT